MQSNFLMINLCSSIDTEQNIYHFCMIHTLIHSFFCANPFVQLTYANRHVSFSMQDKN